MKLYAVAPVSHWLQKHNNNNFKKNRGKVIIWENKHIYRPTDSVASYYTYWVVLMTQWSASHFQRLKWQK